MEFVAQAPPLPPSLLLKPVCLAGPGLNATQLYLVVCAPEECLALVLPDWSLLNLSDSLSGSDRNDFQLCVITGPLRDIRAQEGKELPETQRSRAYLRPHIPLYLRAPTLTKSVSLQLTT